MCSVLIYGLVFILVSMSSLRSVFCFVFYQEKMKEKVFIKKKGEKYRCGESLHNR